MSLALCAEAYDKLTMFLTFGIPSVTFNTVNYLIRQLLLSTRLISASRLQMLLFPLHFLGGCSE